MIQTCVLEENGCRDWTAGVDCQSTGDLCDETTGDATCVPSCVPPGVPTGPVPAHQANVDAAAVSSLDWADAAGATSYAVYFSSSCPPPTYPSGVFSTVTSGDDTFAAGTTTGTYTLTFNEPVSDVAANLIWTPVVGTGILTNVQQVDSQTYQVSFSGAADGDVYSLTVGTGVTDSCGAPLGAPVTITLTFSVTDPGMICEAAYDVSGSTFPVQLIGTFDDDPTLGASCDGIPTNAVWFTYTPSASGLHIIDLSNTTTTAFSRVAVFESTSCNPYGTELSCATSSSRSISTTVSLTAGTSYLILFFTDGNSYTMVDPEITITAP